MKVRQGFVSNSSSSSFVLAIKKGESLKRKVLVEVDLEWLATDRVSTVEELDKMYLEKYGYGCQKLEEMFANYDKYLRKEYNHARKLIGKGYEIFSGTVAGGGEGSDEIRTHFYSHGMGSLKPKTGLIVVQDSKD